MHDDQAGRAFAGLYKGVRHVTGDEERVACLDAQDLLSRLDLELSLPHKKPLIDVHVVVKSRPDLFRPQGIEDHASALVVFTGDHHVKGCVEKVEGFVVSVFACFYQDLLPIRLGDLSEERTRRCQCGSDQGKSKEDPPFHSERDSCMGSVLAQ